MTEALPATATTPQDAPRAARRRDPYLLLSGAVLVWAVGVVVQHTWTADFLLHAGTVQALARDLLSPPDPMVGSGSGSPYYSPYVLLAAVAVRLTGLWVATVLGVLGLLNVVVLLWAFRRFCGWFTASGGAAVALLATLFLWGVRPPVWSGFLSMRSLAEVLPYPSTLAFALMLLGWDRLLRYRRDRDVRSLAQFAVLVAAVTVVHSFSAVNMAVGVLALLVAFRWSVADLARIGAAGIGGVAIAALWPYSSLWSQAASGGDFADIHRQLLDMLLDPRQLACGYVLLALVPLALRWRRDRRDPLVLLFAVTVVAVVGAAAAGQYQYLRLLPVAMLAAHVAFGAFLADGGPRLARRLTAAAALVALGAGLLVDVTPLGGLVGAVPVRWLPGTVQPLARTPSLSGPSREFDYVRDLVPPGSVVLTDGRWSDRHLNWLGYFTVNPGWPNPWLADGDQRAADRATFRDPATTAERRGEIARRYDARCVLLNATPAVGGPAAVDGYPLVRTGPGGSLHCRS